MNPAQAQALYEACRDLERTVVSVQNAMNDYRDDAVPRLQAALDAGAIPHELTSSVEYLIDTDDLVASSILGAIGPLRKVFESLVLHAAPDQTAD